MRSRCRRRLPSRTPLSPCPRTSSPSPWARAAIAAATPRRTATFATCRWYASAAGPAAFLAGRGFQGAPDRPDLAPQHDHEGGR